MRNDAVVRALERLTGTEVIRCNKPELMGAFGCALYARRHSQTSLSLEDILSKAHYTTHTLHCKGCDNHCQVFRYRFDNGKNYYSGNRCEKFSQTVPRKKPVKTHITSRTSNCFNAFSLKSRLPE